MSPSIEYRQLRVPREHGAALVVPSWSEVGPMLAENRTIRDDWQVTIGGRPLAELAAQARRELLEAAYQYTGRYRAELAPPPVAEEVPILLAGHQPQLFHAGVWLKNFALSALARRHGGVGINLLIDNDTVGPASIKVPGGTPDDPRLAAVPFDAAGGEVAFEECRIVDRATFDSFAGRVEEQLGGLVDRPLIGDFWPLAVEAADLTGNLGRSLAQARHQWEARWGAQTLEVPLGTLSEGNAFRHFIAGLLGRLPELFAAYNSTLDQYRRTARIRSRHHPVPNLQPDGPWLEVPLWVWREGAGLRRRVFARAVSRDVLLSDRHGWETRLSLEAGGATDDAAGRLAEIRRQGVKLRPRALVTTMFARLLLGDLFIHGIGGAKYDEVTDSLVRRLFHVEPSAYMVLSGTALLPVERPNVTRDDVRRVDQLLRELRFHPEDHLDGAAASATVQAAIDRKRHWIAQQPPRGERGERHRQITAANDAMQPLLASRRDELLAERSDLAVKLRKQAILGSREYAFCLFPEAYLKDWVQQLLPSST